MSGKVVHLDAYRRGLAQVEAIAAMARGVGHLPVEAPARRVLWMDPDQIDTWVREEGYEPRDFWRSLGLVPCRMAIGDVADAIGGLRKTTP
jgi:hypothetical protein